MNGWTLYKFINEMKEQSNQKKEFIPFLLPENRGTFTIDDVIKKEPGIERDQAIEIWCKSVWKAYESCKSFIIDYLEKNS